MLRRITYGPTPADLTAASALGYSGYLEQQLDYTAIDDSASDARIAGFTTLTMLPYQLFAANIGTIRNELIDAALLRSIFSARQLYQRMVEFWTDHFNIDINNGDDAYFKTVDDRDVIRPHALGSFPAMLDASAHSPAMLYYLDNNTSTAGNPNENYARELMELHTMGADGGYTQNDVHEVARCFTGWTLFRGTVTNPQYGTFRYNSAVHDTAQKVVLGNIIPPRSAAAGIQDALDVLNILVNHPSTAQFVSKKLCRFLLSETPPQSVIDSVAAAYTSTGGDIKAMVRAALAPNVLADAPLKYKRPFHLFVSGLRVMPTTITALTGVRTDLTSAGHMPFFWGPPDGYPDALDYWGGLILPRWNFGARLLNNNVSGSTVDYATFFTGAANADQMADRINQNMFLGEMPVVDRNRIRDHLLPNTPTTTRQREALGLAIGAPAFQWY